MTEQRAFGEGMVYTGVCDVQDRFLSKSSCAQKTVDNRYCLASEAEQLSLCSDQ